MNGETWKGFQREDIVPSSSEAIHLSPCTISRLYRRAFVLVRREQMTKISSCARVSAFGFYQPVRCLTLDPLSWIFGKQWNNLARNGTGGPSNENRSNRAFPCCCLATPRNHARPPSSLLLPSRFQILAIVAARPGIVKQIGHCTQEMSRGAAPSLGTMTRRFKLDIFLRHLWLSSLTKPFSGYHGHVIISSS